MLSIFFGVCVCVDEAYCCSGENFSIPTACYRYTRTQSLPSVLSLLFTIYHTPIELHLHPAVLTELPGWCVRCIDEAALSVVLNEGRHVREISKFLASLISKVFRHIVYGVV